MKMYTKSFFEQRIRGVFLLFQLLQFRTLGITVETVIFAA